MEILPFGELSLLFRVLKLDFTGWGPRGSDLTSSWDFGQPSCVCLITFQLGLATSSVALVLGSLFCLPPVPFSKSCSGVGPPDSLNSCVVVPHLREFFPLFGLLLDVSRRAVGCTTAVLGVERRPGFFPAPACRVLKEVS